MKKSLSKEKQVVFILNAPRSGSTLLKSILDKHPKIFAPSELHLWQYDHLEDAKAHLRLTRMADGILECFTRLLGSKEEAQKAYHHLKSQKKPPRAILQWIMERQNENFLIDKSPTYPSNIDVLNRIEAFTMPNNNKKPLYIFIRRHPFDVFKSMIENDFHKLIKILNINRVRMIRADKDITSPLLITYSETSDNPCKTPLEKIESFCFNSLRNIGLFLNGIPQERQFHLSYNELVSNSKATILKMCNFLGIDYCEDMLHPYEYQTKHKNMKESVGDPNYYNHKTINRDFVMKWKKNESWWKEQVFSQTTLEMARHIGYEFPVKITRSPLTPAQKTFILNYNNIIPPYFLIVQYEINFSKNKFQEDHFKKSLKNQIKRFATLRTYFQEKNGNWLQYIDHVCDFDPLNYKDISMLSKESDQNHVISEGIKKVKSKINPSKSPLFKILIHKKSNNSYHVCYVFHHLIIDGSSMLKFHKALWDEYYEIENLNNINREFELNYAARMDYLEKEYPVQNDLNFWTKCNGKPTNWSKRLLEKIEDNTSSSEDVYTEAIKINKFNSPASFNFHAIAIALYQVIAKLDNSTIPLLIHRLNRRKPIQNEPNSRSVTWIAGDAPVRLNLKDTNFDLAQQLKLRLNELPLGGVSYDWLIHRNILPPLHTICPIRFNYYPLKRKEHYNETHFTDLTVDVHHGKSMMRDFIIDFIVRDNIESCKIIIRYSKNIISSKEIENLFMDWRIRFLELTKNDVRASHTNLLL